MKKCVIIIFFVVICKISFGQCQEYLNALKTFFKNELCKGIKIDQIEMQKMLTKMAYAGCGNTVNEFNDWIKTCTNGINEGAQKNCFCGGNVSSAANINTKPTTNTTNTTNSTGRLNLGVNPDGSNNQGGNFDKIPLPGYESKNRSNNSSYSSSNYDQATNNLTTTVSRSIANSPVIKPTLENIKLDFDNNKTNATSNNSSNTLIDANNVKQIITSNEATKETSFKFSEEDFDKIKSQKEEDRFIPVKLIAFTLQEFNQKMQNKISNCKPKTAGELDIDFSVNEFGKLVGVSIKSNPVDKELEDNFSNEVLFKNNIAPFWSPATRNGKAVGDVYNMKISYAANRNVASLTKPLVNEKKEEVKLLPGQLQLSKEEVDEYADQYKQSLKSKVLDFFGNLKDRVTLKDERDLIANSIKLLEYTIKEDYHLVVQLEGSNNENIQTKEDLKLKQTEILKRIDERMLFTKKIMIKGVIYRLVSENSITKMGTYEIDEN